MKFKKNFTINSNESGRNDSNRSSVNVDEEVMDSNGSIIGHSNLAFENITTEDLNSSHKKHTSIKMDDNQGSVLHFHDVVYTVSMRPPGRKCGSVSKEILKEVSGMFKPGMNAILGPTGGGKSTLLDILAGRKSRVGLTGLVLIDGKKQPHNFNRLAGYVTQEDIVMGTMSVRENIMFSANLRLPKSLGHQEKVLRVENVIKDLGLTKCADSKVGTEFIRGVSGGEKKRTNIGIEMIVSQKILFLDEPTTGLDSNTASAVMGLLHKLSLQGRTIIFSIHQPRYTIFKYFHRLMLLADGRTVYHGPAQEALSYFSSIGYTCEEHNNPSDFFLDVIKEDLSLDDKNETEENEATVVETRIDDVMNEHHQGTASIPFTTQLNERFKQSVWFQKVQSELEPILKLDHSRHKAFSPKNLFDDYTTNFFTQLKYLSRRALLNLIRNPMATVIQIIISTVFAIIIGLIFLQLNKKTDGIEVALQNRLGALFFITMNQIFSNLAAVELFIRERVIFLHESGSGYYRTSSYFFAKIFCDIIPMRLLPLTIFAIITYFMIGFATTAGQFFIYYFCLILTSFSASSLCFAISASVSTQAVASLFISFLYVLMMLFGGFLANVKSMGDWLNWLSYFSIVRYSLNIQYINQLRGAEILVRNITFSNGTSVERLYLDSTSATQRLKDLDVKYETTYDLWSNFLALSCYMIILLIITYIKLRRIPKYK